jgi:hypothetical protein
VKHEGGTERTLDAARSADALSDSVARSIPDARGDATREALISIRGQVIVFRVGRAAVLRKLGWSTIGDKELEIIQTHLHKTVTAQLPSPNRRVVRTEGRKGRR